VTDQFFICHSGIKADEEFALRLADSLEAGPPPYRVWLDVRQLQPGDQWDAQIVRAIRECRAVLFVMTADSVTDESECKHEWVRALKYKKPVIPLRAQREAELPFRLDPRQFVDFADGFDVGLARLRAHLRWRGTPDGVLGELRDRLGDAQREHRRASSARRSLIEDEIRDLDRRIRDQERLIEDPDAATVRTEERIAGGLERERQPVQRAAVERTRFVFPPPLLAPTWFQDRHVETAQIGEFLADDGLRVMQVVGRGGVGKTAMVCRLLKALERGRLPDEGGPMEVGGIVYLNKIGGHPVSFPNLFAGLCRLLPDEVAEGLQTRSRDSAEHPAALMTALLAAFSGRRTVVLLDNFEDVVDLQTLAVTDTALGQALRTVLTAPPHSVKIVITTRFAPKALQLVEPARQRRLDLDEGLASPYAEQLLRAMDASGSLGLKNAPEALLGQARARTRGYPRALELLAGILAADRDTSLPELLADTGRLPGDVVGVLVGEAFNRLDPLAQHVMQALAVFPVAVPAVAVDYLLQPYRQAIDSAPVLARLVNMHFASRDAGRYSVHQVDRDYALGRVPVGESTDRIAAELPSTQHALQTRGADYFALTRTPRETWKNLDDLASQLVEFDLRCQAGDYYAAAGVLYDIDHDYLMVWGHIALMVDLHERVQDQLTDPGQRADSKQMLGRGYADLGQIPRAIDCYEQALAIYREIGNSGGEAEVLHGLAFCYYLRGQISGAIDLYEQALAINRQDDDRYGEASRLNSLGLCYSYLGQNPGAINFYEQALAINREIGWRAGVAGNLGNLGRAHMFLGQIPEAIDLYEQAFAIDREISSRQGEAVDLGQLGLCYAAQGQTARAIDLYEQALAIHREIGHRRGVAAVLNSLGRSYAALGQISQAMDLYGQACAIADESGLVQQASSVRVSLAMAMLAAGDLPTARTIAETASTLNHLPDRLDLSVTLGVVYLRQGDRGAARGAFHAVVAQADDALAAAPGNHRALDNKALALCGLAVVDQQPDFIDGAASAFAAARAITTAVGLVADVLRRLDTLAVADDTGILDLVRSAAAGPH
jgi:tetratricopeptide (TPR) repeat protein